MNILIIANSQILQQAQIVNLLVEIDMIIAADGGANVCLANLLKPDIIIGDLDSITEETSRFFSEITIIHEQEQDTTDMEKALKFSLKYHPTTIYLSSIFGNRLDHSMANAIIIENFVRLHKLPVVVIDPSGILKILPPGVYRPKVIQGNTVSFYSFSSLENLELRKFKYNILSQTFHDFFLGISNEYVQNDCYISFSEGVLFWFERVNDPESIRKIATIMRCKN